MQIRLTTKPVEDIGIVFLHQCIMYILTSSFWFYITFHGQFRYIRHAIKKSDHSINGQDHGTGFAVDPWNAGQGHGFIIALVHIRISR